MEVITDISQLDLNKSYTFADYLSWQFSEMVELIKGKIYRMTPAPIPLHQRFAGNIFTEISVYLKKKPYKVYIAPFDVYLPIEKTSGKPTVVQPDICVICDPSKIDNKGCIGAPDMIVEILSPSTTHKDVKEKFDVYESSGVNEYWIVSPGDKIIDIFLLENDKYQLKGKFTLGDKVSPYTLPELIIDLDEVFED
jgi:Uma2 family endonuclease